MAITARKLRRLEAWSNWQAAGGSRVSVVDDAIAARASVTLQNEQLLVTLPLDSISVPSLSARKVIRIDQEDAHTNDIPWSYDLTHWTVPSGVNGSATLNAVGIGGLANTATTLADTSTALQQAFIQVSIGTNSALHYFQYRVKKDAVSSPLISLWSALVSPGTLGRRLDLNTSTGAFTVASSGAPSYFAERVTLSADGLWWIVEMVVQNDGTRTLAQPTIYIAGSTATDQRSEIIGHAQHEPNQGMPSIPLAPIVTNGTSGTRDAIFDEYKIIERAVDDENGLWAITASPFRLTDLAGAGLVSRKDSDGVVVYDFEVLGLTPTEIVTNWVLPALAAVGYSWISIGNITPTARMDMTFAWDTPLSVLLRVASATTSELDIRKSGSGYVIDILPKINSSAQQADIRIDKNLVNITRTESSIEQATRIFPKGSVQDELAGTMARARWQVSAVAARTTNSLTFANDIANAAWSKTATMGAVLNAVGIDGRANGATTLTDVDGAVFQSASRVIAIANDNATHTVSIYFTKDSNQSRFPQVKLILTGGTTQVQRAVAINTATGATSLHNTSGTGTFRTIDGATIHPLLANWWILEITATNNTSGNTSAQVQIYPAAGTVLGADNAAATGSTIVGLAQLELNASVFGPPIITGAAAITSNDITLFDAAGGVGPIGFDNQLLFSYLRRADGSLVQVIGSNAATEIVTVAGNTGIAAGDLIEFRADSAGGDLTYLENPSAVMAYGIKSAIREVSDVPATNNLIKNPVMRTWPGTLPTNWTAVNAPTTAKQTAAPFTALGGASIKVTSTADGQGVVSDAVSIFPTATNPYVSGFAKVWVASGNVRVELLFTTPTGTKIFPALPDVASATVLGQWLDLGESGYDANAVAATAVAIRVVQHSAAASVFYVDAAQVTSTGTQQPFFEGSGATRLWQEANSALVDGSTPVASYTVPLVDLEAYDPVTWSESALIIGANARIVDPRLSIDIVTRIVGIERDYINPENISVTLSNKPEDLTDILATVSRPEREPGASDPPLTNPQQPKLSASFDINGQLIINSAGDNDVTSQKIAWATGSAPSAATVRAATAITQQNISGLATGSTYAQGVTVFIAAFAYNSRGFESSPLMVISESRQGAIIDYTPFASNLTPIKLVSVLPASGAFVGEIVFLTTDKKLYRWDGAAWLSAVASTDITGQIQTAQIADSAITALKLGALAVTAGKIAANAVGSTEIASLSITNAKIAANAVDTAKLAANAVTTTELAALAVTGAKIAALTITAGNIAAHTISANEIAALTITAAEIAAGAITAAKISAGAITAGKLAVGWGGAALNSDPGTTDFSAWFGIAGSASIVTLTDGKVGPTALRSTNGYWGGESARIPYDPTKSYRVRAWARRSAGATGRLYIGCGVFNHAGGFADASGNYFYIAASNVIASTTWTEYQGVLPANRSWATTPETIAIVLLLDYNVSEAQYMEAQDVRLEEVLPGTLIQDGVITTNHIAANTIQSGDIAALTIVAANIAAGTITSAELAATSVIAGKIAANAVTATEIAALTITGAKIAAGTITADKLVANSITAGQIQAGAISATELAAGAVTAGKIAAGVITATELAAGSITVDKLVVNSLVDACFAIGDGVAHSIANVTSASYDWSTSDVVDTTGDMHGSGFPAAIYVRRTGGIVFITAQVDWDGNTVGSRQLDITKNDTSVIMSDLSDAAGVKDYWQTVMAVDYNPTNGDYYRVQVTQSSGGTRTVSYQTFRVVHLKL